MNKLILVIIAAAILAGCSTPPAKEQTAAPPDVSGVDVPVLLLQRQAYVPPKDASNDAFFAAHSENKGVSKLQDFQMGLISELMVLSHTSGHKITLHGSRANE